MTQRIDSARVRALLSGCMTTRDAAASLRRHGVRYWYSTDGGVLHLFIPGRSGAIIRVYGPDTGAAPVAVTYARQRPHWFRMPTCRPAE